MDIDLSNLTIVQVLSLTVVVTILDVVGAMLIAAGKGTFSIAYVAAWLQSHTVKRVFPIFALAWLGHGVPQIDIPAIPAFFGMAIAGLATYLLETVKSIQENFTTNPAPTDESPVPSA